MNPDRPMLRDGFRFFEDRRARYNEIDAQGVVYNARYLDFFDLIVTDYIINLRPDYYEWAKIEKCDFHAVHVDIDYAKPLRLGDAFSVGARIDRLGRSSIHWRCAIFPAAEFEPTATGRLVWSFADQVEMKSAPLPDDLRAAIHAYEDGR